MDKFLLKLHLIIFLLVDMANKRKFVIVSQEKQGFMLCSKVQNEEIAINRFNVYVCYKTNIFVDLLSPMQIFSDCKFNFDLVV